MAFLTDWIEFPDRKTGLLYLARGIKDDASGDIVRPALAMEIQMMLDGFAKELLKPIDHTNDQIDVTWRVYIKSALIELGRAVISNERYREAVKAHAKEYFTLAMMEFNSDKDAMKLLADVSSILGVKIDVDALIKQQIYWIQCDIDDREFKKYYRANIGKSHD